MNIKNILYQKIVKIGIFLLRKFFPEHFQNFQSGSLKPDDRYLEYPFAIKCLPKIPARVLDVGCTDSFFSLILSALGYETYGIDIRPYEITNKLSIPNFKFIKGSIINTSFADNYFDAIIAISTVEHIGLGGRYGAKEDMSADNKAIQEMRRILKPQGSLILTFPFGVSKIIRPFTRVYGTDQVKCMAKGFSISEEEYFTRDKNDDWYKCDKEEAMKHDSTGHQYSIFLIKLKKE